MNIRQRVEAEVEKLIPLISIHYKKFQGGFVVDDLQYEEKILMNQQIVKDRIILANVLESYAKRCEGLREALRKYGNHISPFCAKTDILPLGGISNKCDCGYDKALSPTSAVEAEISKPSLPKFNPPVELTKRDLELSKTESLLERMADWIEEVNSDMNMTDIAFWWGETHGEKGKKLIAEYEQRKGGA